MVELLIAKFIVKTKRIALIRVTIIIMKMIVNLKEKRLWLVFYM